jgi:hypothetical protein
VKHWLKGAQRTSLQQELEAHRPPAPSRSRQIAARADRRLREEAAIATETSHNDAPELIEAISQLRSILALPIGLTTDYLIRLQNAIEVAERAVRAERWAREGCEFLGE